MILDILLLTVVSYVCIILLGHFCGKDESDLVFGSVSEVWPYYTPLLNTLILLVIIELIISNGPHPESILGRKK